MLKDEMLEFDIISSLISQIFSKKKSIKLTKYAIHKVLFKLKVELSLDNPIREYLPFYWYNYGPFSEVVESNIDALKESGILKEYYTNPEENTKILGFEYEWPLSEVEGIDEAENKLNSIVQRVDFYHLNSFVNEIYREHAPCAFMPLFKLDFLRMMENYVERTSSGQRTLYKFSGGYPPEVDKLESILYDCEAELSSAPLFKPFNNAFSSFVTNAGRVFDYIRNNGDNLPYLGGQILHAADITWLTFAKGIRILDVGHDKYYDNRLGTWKSQYMQSLATFYTHVDNFNSDILAEIKPTRLIISEPSEKSKNILLSVVDGYLK